MGDRKWCNFAGEISQAGDLILNGIDYLRMQMLTVADILDGKRFNTPSTARARGQRRQCPNAGRPMQCHRPRARATQIRDLADVTTPQYTIVFAGD